MGHPWWLVLSVGARGGYHEKSEDDSHAPCAGTAKLYYRLHLQRRVIAGRYEHVCPIFRVKQKCVWCSHEQKVSLLLLSKARPAVVPGHGLQRGKVLQALPGLTYPQTVSCDCGAQNPCHKLFTMGGKKKNHWNQPLGLPSNLTLTWDTYNPSHK